MGGISIWQLLIILVIVLVLFGGNRLRNLGSDLGTAIRGFRDSMKEGDKPETAAEETRKLEQLAAQERTTDQAAGVNRAEWGLLTNRAAQTLDDLVELIEWYRCRWEIETFFNVLKNGCRVEALQLGSVGKIELALAVYMVVSWRLARLIRLGRTHPDLMATTLFTDEEWKGAYILAKKPVPKTTPTLRELIRRIAMLGGFLARKSDGEPGVKTLWLGYQRIRDFVDGDEHMRSINAV